MRATWNRASTRTEMQVEAAHVRPACLVLDEWQLTRDTPDENLILMQLIDKRYDAGRATLIVASDLTPAQFDAAADARLSDRMHDGGGVIVCPWGSLRGLS